MTHKFWDQCLQMLTYQYRVPSQRQASDLTQSILNLSSVVPGDSEVRISLYGLAVVGYGSGEVHVQVLDVTSAVVGVGDGGSVFARVLVAIYEMAEELA